MDKVANPVALGRQVPLSGVQAGRQSNGRFFHLNYTRKVYPFLCMVATSKGKLTRKRNLILVQLVPIKQVLYVKVKTPAGKRAKFGECRMAIDAIAIVRKETAKSTVVFIFILSFFRFLVILVMGRQLLNRDSANENPSAQFQNQIGGRNARHFSRQKGFAKVFEAMLLWRKRCLVVAITRLFQRENLG